MTPKQIYDFEYSLIPTLVARVNNKDITLESLCDDKFMAKVAKSIGIDKKADFDDMVVTTLLNDGRFKAAMYYFPTPAAPLHAKYGLVITPAAANAKARYFTLEMGRPDSADFSIDHVCWYLCEPLGTDGHLNYGELPDAPTPWNFYRRVCECYNSRPNSYITPRGYAWGGPVAAHTDVEGFSCSDLVGSSKFVESICHAASSNPGAYMAGIVIGHMTESGIAIVVDSYYEMMSSDTLRVGLSQQISEKSALLASRYRYTPGFLGYWQTNLDRKKFFTREEELTMLSYLIEHPDVQQMFFINVNVGTDDTVDIHPYVFELVTDFFTNGYMLAYTEICWNHGDDIIPPEYLE